MPGQAAYNHIAHWVLEVRNYSYFKIIGMELWGQDEQGDPIIAGIL